MMDDVAAFVIFALFWLVWWAATLKGTYNLFKYNSLFGP